MKHPTFGRPNHEHGPRYAHVYLAQTNGKEDLLHELKRTRDLLIQAWKNIPSDKEDFRYAEGKWSIKGVISHVIDTERIFAYRALRFSRHDDTPIEGYEQDLYDANSNLDNRSIATMIAEFESVRNNTILLFESMIQEQLDFVGTASHNPLSPRTAGWIIVGHALHHQDIIFERYL